MYILCLDVRIQRKERSLAVAVDLDGVYDKVLFKLLMELLSQGHLSVMITRWITPVLVKGTIDTRAGIARW